jgi:hypothetical protein
MFTVPALRKVREERGTLDCGKTNELKVGPPGNHFCLVPTTELFKAVCAVLEAPEDEGLKTIIRDSLFVTVGQWSFAREKRHVNAAPSLCISR